jgi:hypothetical protein
MKSIPIRRQTVNMQTGDVTEDRMVDVGLLPPSPSACQVCGKTPAHPLEMPHDAQSLYYQYAFYGEHGRWPTWKDAMTHCTDEMKVLWERELKARGVVIG